MRTVSYQINTKEGLKGDPGLFYDYILAENGLFIRAAGPLIKATVCIGPAIVRGLSPVEGKIELTHGLIPGRLYDLAVSVVTGESYEHYMSIIWKGEYWLEYPEQEGAGAGVKYENLPNTVLDIHSHGGMGAFFSGTDNGDEQGLRLSLVLGKVDTLEPEYDLRLGVYGYFATVELGEVYA
jgi:PRTRC genetic system protein A